MTTSSTYDIVTPEAVVLDLAAAGLASRICAKIIDLLIYVIAGTILVMIVSLLLTGAAAGRTVVMVTLAVLVFLLVLIVPAFVESATDGRSPGKSALGLRVVTTDGGPISFRHAIVRGFMQLVELPTGIGILVALASARSRRWGDMMAGTFVIKEPPVLQQLTPYAFFAPEGCEDFVERLDVGRLTSDQFLLIRDYLLRVNSFSPAARYNLAVGLANPLRAMSSPEPPAWVQPEMYLVCVAAAYQIRTGTMPPPSQLAAQRRAMGWNVPISGPVYAPRLPGPIG